MTTPADRAFTNDAREGKTNAGFIEIKQDKGTPPVYNRAYARSVGYSTRGRVCPPYHIELKTT